MSMNFEIMPKYENMNCGICRNILNDDVVSHRNGGEKHPFHKTCVRQWVKIKSTCPICRVSINPTSLNSEVERSQNRCKISLREKISVIYGITLGLSLMFFQSIVVTYFSGRLKLTNLEKNILTCSGGTILIRIISRGNDRLMKKALIISWFAAAIFSAYLHYAFPDRPSWMI